jgi:hypothetical protein
MKSHNILFSKSRVLAYLSLGGLSSKLPCSLQYVATLLFGRYKTLLCTQSEQYLIFQGITTSDSDLTLDFPIKNLFYKSLEICWFSFWVSSFELTLSRFSFLMERQMNLSKSLFWNRDQFRVVHFVLGANIGQ